VAAGTAVAAATGLAVNASVTGPGAGPGSSRIALAASATGPGSCSAVSAGPAREVVSNAVRTKLRLGVWPDTALGVLRDSSGGYRFLSADGGPAQQVAITSGTLADPVSGGVTSALPVADVPAGYSYAGGGPVYQDPGTGMVLQVLHLERAYPDSGGFWSELDLGLLNQATGQATVLGPIVRPSASFAQAEAAGRSVDIGDSALSAAGGYLYVYFPDTAVASSGSLQTTGLSAARAPLADVLAAAQKGTVAQWSKYGAGGWTVPSLGGGDIADLNSGEVPVWHPDVVHSSALGADIMVSGVSSNQMDLASSADGIHWSQRVPLFRDPGDFDAYPTLVSEGASPADPGKSFYLYYTQWLSSAQNWANAHLMRREITCISGSPAATIPFVRYYNGKRHEVTTAPPDAGYTKEGQWYLLTSEQPGTVPIYGCRNGALLVDQFISRDSNCESSSNAITQTEGWIYASPPAVPSTPLYRCHIAGLGDHFVSIESSCEASGIVNEGLLGYAPTTPENG
jgi:hypothetical protein